MTRHGGGSRWRSQQCERRAITIADLHAELAALVEAGALEVVIGPDGVERYQRPEDPFQPST